MKNKKNKVIVAFLSIILIIFLGGSVSEAGTASITASSKNVSVGDPVTISVTGTAKTWSLKASGSGISGGSIVGGNLSSKSNQAFSESYSLDTSKPGTYTISLSGDVTDADGTFSDISDSVTITVAEKSTQGNTDKKSGQNTNTGANNQNNTTNNNQNVEQEKEPSFKSSNDTVYATGTINVRKSYSTSSDVIGSLETGESVTRTGIGDNGWSKVTYNGGTGYIKTSLLTTEEPAKKLSSDKSLKSLEITPEGLDPDFDAETTTYTLEVGADIEKLDINAVPNDENAKIEISGNESLQVGDNVVKITVTAEDETIRTYIINVKKQEAATIGLTSLKVDGYKLSPNFSSSIYEYKLSVLDPSVTKLDIATVASDESAVIDISGNADLKNGENTVVITVKSADEKDKVIYKIYVNKTPISSSTPTETTQTKSKLPLYIGIVLIVCLVILMIIIIVKNKKNTELYDDGNQEDYQDLYGYSSKNSKISDDEYEVPNADKNKVEENKENTYEYDYDPYSDKKGYGDYDNKDTSPYQDLFGTIDGIDESYRETSINNSSNQTNNYELEDENQDFAHKVASSTSLVETDENNQDFDDDYTIDNNYKMRRSKGKHSK